MKSIRELYLPADGYHLNMGMNTQRGFGLTEIMVSLVIGLLVVASAISLFLGGRQSFRVQSALANLQENLRSAQHYLALDIRQAGYIGCMPLSAATPNVVASSQQSQLTPDTAIQGYGSAPGAAAGMTWPSNWPAKPTNMVPGTDAIRIMRARSDSTTVISPMSTDSAQIKTQGYPTGVDTGGAAIITDCGSADIFSPTGISTSVGSGVVTIDHGSAYNTTPLLSQAYANGAQVAGIESVLYYVGTDSSGRENLYREDNMTGASEMIAQNIHGFWIQYGYDTTGDGSVSEYLDAPAIAAMAPPNGWHNVRSVRIELVATSERKNLVAHPQQYTFGGASVIAGDKRIYEVSRFTVTRRD